METCVYQPNGVSFYYPVTCDYPGAFYLSSSPEPAQPQPQGSPFYMDSQTAVAIGGAMLLSMSVAWVFRMARKSLEGPEGPESE